MFTCYFGRYYCWVLTLVMDPSGQQLHPGSGSGLALGPGLGGPVTA